MKSSFGDAPGKKVPESKKYAHIGSSIDTGATAKKQQHVSSSAAARRRDEIFKRIKPATLVRMLQESEVNESIFALGEPGDDGGSASSVVASKAGPAASTAAASAASMHSVAGSVLSVVESDATVDQSRDLVLLDLREPSDFEACHLPLAMSYPATKINRDQFSPELYRCKRDTSKLLVIYHNDDQSTAGIATLLVQKGWETVHVLSGGFEDMITSYPEVLEGEVPERPGTGGTTRSSRTSTSRR
jgi:rhodanese-related sulfurtransferase